MSDNDHNLSSLTSKLKTNLDKFPEGNNFDIALESVFKHLPTYLKIIKGHITQLEAILQKDIHHNRNLESANLATCVQQLIVLFQQLQEKDLKILEELVIASKNWSKEFINREQDEVILEHKDSTSAYPAHKTASEA